MKYANRPSISIPHTREDWLIEMLALLGFLLLVGLPMYYLDQLPDSIPTHFGLDGKPDAFGKKISIWILPVIGGTSYLLMLYLSRYPHLFNYPVDITEENATQHYKIGARLVRVMNAVITCFMAYLVYSTSQTALGYQDGLSIFVAIGFLITILGITVYFIRAHRQER